jgi:hypothetical protein
MRAIGGSGDLCGSVIWHVVGLDESLETWAKRRRMHNKSIWVRKPKIRKDASSEAIRRKMNEDDALSKAATLAHARRLLIQGLQLLDAHLRPRSEPDPERVTDGNLADLTRLTSMVAAIDDPAAPWLASALRYWQQNPDASFELAIGLQPDARRRDLMRRRDSALRRLASRFRFRSDAETAGRIAKLVAQFEARAADQSLESGQAADDLREVVDCGGVPSARHLRRILGG